jgi:hypothetical protein
MLTIGVVLSRVAIFGSLMSSPSTTAGRVMAQLMMFEPRDVLA